MYDSTIFKQEHQTFRDVFGKFLDTEAVPFHAQWEKNAQVSRELWTKAGQNGFLCPMLPEKYGGAGTDFLYNAIIGEEISKRGLSGVAFNLHSDIIAPYIEHHGSEVLKEKYLPKMASGEYIGAIAMTEPGTGSDLQAIKTTAILKGDHYILNGAKTFISNGQLCDLVIVVAKTDPEEKAKGISLFLVEAKSPGFSKGKTLEKIGMKAQDTAELFFQNVKVPKENLLGEEGEGFMYLMQELPQERLVVSIAAVNACEAMLQWTIKYTSERSAFGKPIKAFQNTKFKMAELYAQVVQARVFLDHCIEMHLKKELDVAKAAMLKLNTTELQCKVADECLQLFGGYGYMAEYPISKAWVDSRVQRIYAGTNEIMKEIISRFLWY